MLSGGFISLLEICLIKKCECKQPGLESKQHRHELMNAAN